VVGKVGAVGGDTGRSSWWEDSLEQLVGIQVETAGEETGKKSWWGDR
jgi:phage gp46-like protein